MDKIKEIKIPFDKDGNMTRYEWYSDYDFIDNHIFEDTLVYDGHYRGRSTMTIFLTSLHNTNKKGKPIKYTMFYNEFEKILLGGDMYTKMVSGKWSFIKQGANYSLVYLGK